MCLVVVYLEPADREGERMLAHSDVAFVKCEGEGVIVTDLLGQTKMLKAQIRTIDLMKNEIVLEQKG